MSLDSADVGGGGGSKGYSLLYKVLYKVYKKARFKGPVYVQQLPVRVASVGYSVVILCLQRLAFKGILCNAAVCATLVFSKSGGYQSLGFGLGFMVSVIGLWG